MIFCQKVNKKSELESTLVSWSGDSIDVCKFCRMTIWDKNFNDFHNDLINKDDFDGAKNQILSD